MDRGAGSPKEQLDRVRRVVTRSARGIGLALLAVGGLVLWRRMTYPYAAFELDGANVLLAAALIGGGIYLLRDDAPGAEGTPRTKVARPRKPHSPLVPLTLALVFVVEGVAIGLGDAGVAVPSVGQLAALALLIVGAGLVVGAWWGRARWLIPIGVLMTLPVLMASFIHTPLRGRLGSEYLQPQSAARIPTEYKLLYGSVDVDLFKASDFTGTKQLHITAGAGHVSIYAPQRLNLTLDAHVEWGKVIAGGRYRDGADLSVHRDYPGRPGAGTLEVDVDGGLVSVYVERLSAEERGVRPRRAHKGRAAKGGRGDDEARSQRHARHKEEGK